jgi:hypothetical protein
MSHIDFAMNKTTHTALLLAGCGVPLVFFCEYENYTFTFYAARPIIAIKEDDDPDAFSAAPGDGFLAKTGKTWQKLQPSGCQVVYQSQGSEHRSWKGSVLLRKQAAKAASDRFKQGVVAP